jgi:hypothetical protein
LQRATFPRPWVFLLQRQAFYGVLELQRAPDLLSDVVR